MQTTIEAEIDVDGHVRLLEPVKITRKSRAIVTVLDEESTEGGAAEGGENQKRGGGIRELFGSVSLEDPTGADNESIDADLARAYADTHEDE